MKNLLLILPIAFLAACGQMSAPSAGSPDAQTVHQPTSGDAEATAFVNQQDQAWGLAHRPGAQGIAGQLQAQQQQAPANCGLPFNVGLRWYQICLEDDTWAGYYVRRFYWW